MRPTRLVTLAPLLAALAACGAPPPPPAPPPAPTQAPAPAPSPTQAPAPTPTQSPAPSDPLVRTWRSQVCGTRQYERVITFGSDGTFTAEDRVAPCPPRTVCVWSGIITRKGTFTRAGDTLRLSVSESSKDPGNHPFPEALALDPVTGAPAEKKPDGTLCVYTQ